MADTRSQPDEATMRLLKAMDSAFACAAVDKRDVLLMLESDARILLRWYGTKRLAEADRSRNFSGMMWRGVPVETFVAIGGLRHRHTELINGGRRPAAFIRHHLTASGD